ncbi:MAG: HAD-IB family hydrolase [Calditrichia bacterium]
MASWAVFDVDGTLLPGTSMERMFMKHLVQIRKLPLRNILFYFSRILLKLISEDLTDAFKSNKYYLRRLPVETVREISQELIENEIWSAISSKGLETIDVCRRENYKIMLMSGSPDFLILPLEKKIGADYTIATQMRIEDGQFTGEIVGLHPYGIHKRHLLEKLSPKLKIEFEKSMVFANHHTDALHMELFGKAVAVNPTPKLEKIAGKRQWGIEWWT